MSVPIASNNDDPPGEAQHQSALFEIPAEIRNEIYAHAFGAPSTFYQLTFGKMRVLLKPGDFQPKNNVGRQTFWGLPLWILTCKRLKAEAMELFLRTTTLTILSVHSQVTPHPMLNTMIRSHGEFRNLEFFDIGTPSHLRTPKGNQYGARTREQYQAYLPLVQPLIMRDGSLELVWNLWTTPQLFTQEANVCARLWDHTWNGRFRKVRIKIYVPADHTSGHDQPRVPARIAAACAMRLVGRGGLVTMGERFATSTRPRPAVELLWAIWVVAERKL